MIDQMQGELVSGGQAPSLPSWLDRAAFPFRSRFVSTRFGRLHYVDEGPPESSEVVLLVHGTPSWSFEYRHLIARLSRSRRVVALDHLGFGLSERPPGFAYTPEAHTEVLREALERLGLERFSLVVHDFGGVIALPLVLERPERLQRLVLLNTWLWRLDEDPKFARGSRLLASALGRFLYRWLNASLRLLMPFAYADRSRLTRSIHAQYLAPFRRRDDRVLVLWALARALLASAPSFAQIWQELPRLHRVPSLIVWGLGDRALPPPLLARMRLGFPSARVHELEGVGHFPQEEAPEEVAALLDEFLPRASRAQAKLDGA